MCICITQNIIATSGMGQKLNFSAEYCCFCIQCLPSPILAAITIPVRPTIYP